MQGTLNFDQFFSDSEALTGNGTDEVDVVISPDQWVNDLPGTMNNVGVLNWIHQPPVVINQSGNGLPTKKWQHADDAYTYDFSQESISYSDGSQWKSAGTYTFGIGAQTKVKLFTGGRPGSNRVSMHHLTCNVEQMLLRSAQPYTGWNDEVLIFDGEPVDPAKTAISIGGLGTLNANGDLYVLLPDNIIVDVTPHVVLSGDFYTFTQPSEGKISLQVKALNMIGDGSYTVMNDNASVLAYNWYYVSKNQQRDFPVLYQSADWTYPSTPLLGPLIEPKPVYMVAQPTFRVFESFGFGNMIIKGTASGGGVNHTFWATNGASYPFWTIAIKADNALSFQKVDYYNPLIITWSGYSPDMSTEVSLGTTECPVYVSLQQPTTLDLYRTVVHLACSTPGATTGSQALDNTWRFFSGKSVKTWDGQPLYYYNPQNHTSVPWSSDIAGLLGLHFPNSLTPHNGDCTAFDLLLAASLQENGLNASKVTAGGCTELLAKNYNFTINTNAAAPYNCYPPPCVCPPPSGVAGQNSSPTPQLKLFNNHAIVKAIGYGSIIYYDPSYGIMYSSALDYTHQAIAGWSQDNINWLDASANPTMSLIIQ